jgi:hypothetical protein
MHGMPKRCPCFRQQNEPSGAQRRCRFVAQRAPQQPARAPQRARVTAFYFLENAHFQFKNIFANFVSRTFKSARVLKLCDVPDFLRPFSEFISNSL